MGLQFRILCHDCMEYAELDKFSFWDDCESCTYDNEYLEIIEDIDGWEKDQLAYHLTYALKALRFCFAHKGHNIEILNEDQYSEAEENFPWYACYSNWEQEGKPYKRKYIPLISKDINKDNNLIDVMKPRNIFDKIDIGDVIYFKGIENLYIPHIVVGKTDEYADLLVRDIGIFRDNKEFIDMHGCLTVDDI